MSLEAGRYEDEVELVLRCKVIYYYAILPYSIILRACYQTNRMFGRSPTSITLIYERPPRGEAHSMATSMCFRGVTRY
jgi:hypothetical protein